MTRLWCGNSREAINSASGNKLCGTRVSREAKVGPERARARDHSVRNGTWQTRGSLVARGYCETNLRIYDPSAALSSLAIDRNFRPLSLNARRVLVKNSVGLERELLIRARFARVEFRRGGRDHWKLPLNFCSMIIDIANVHYRRHDARYVSKMVAGNSVIDNPGKSDI